MSLRRKVADMSDGELVEAARAGSAWAQEALFTRHARLANGMAFRLMGRDADVDDLVQDSFLQAFARLNDLENPQAFVAWLSAIIVRLAHKLLRRRRLLSRLGMLRLSPIDLDEVVSQGAPPDVHAELRHLYGKLDLLPAQARIALVLCRVEGLTTQQAAARMGLSESTVKRRLSHAERRIDTWLGRKAPPAKRRGEHV